MVLLGKKKKNAVLLLLLELQLPSAHARSSSLWIMWHRLQNLRRLQPVLNLTCGSTLEPRVKNWERRKGGIFQICPSRAFFFFFWYTNKYHRTQDIIVPWEFLILLHPYHLLIFYRVTKKLWRFCVLSYNFTKAWKGRYFIVTILCNLSLKRAYVWLRG